MCGSGKPQTTINKTEPAAEVKPYIKPFLDQASAAAQRPYEQYQGPRLAGFNNDQRAGFGMTRRAAMQGAMDTDAARNQILDTMGGRFSGGSGSRNPFAGLANPYLQKTIDDATGDISRSYKNGTAANTDAAFSRAGAFGGSAWQEQVANNERELATSLGRTANDMRMQDYGMQANLAESQVGRDENAYQQERGRSMSSLSMLPNLMNNDLRGAQALLGTGDAQQGFDQDALDLSYQDFQQRRDYPLQQLDIMGNALGKVSGVAGGTSTATQTGGPSRNRTSGALGGALAGFQMGGPWGAVLGGLGGLLK